jgi:hypothetical protein
MVGILLASLLLYISKEVSEGRRKALDLWILILWLDRQLR